MTTLQAISLGAMLALTPSILACVWALGLDNKLSSQYPPEILVEDRLACDLRDCAQRINDPLALARSRGGKGALDHGMSDSFASDWISSRDRPKAAFH